MPTKPDDKKPAPPTRKPLFFVRPKDVGSVDGMVDSIADGIANALIKEINAERAKQGLPPLEKD